MDKYASDNIIELYSSEELHGVKRARRIVILLCAVVAAATLAYCILCCVKAQAGEYRAQLIRAVAASTLGGWFVIALRVFVIKRLNYAVKHITAMLSAERQRMEGAFTLAGKRVDIIGGVSIIPAVNAEGQRLSLYAKKLKLYDADKASAVYEALGFITAYEVKNEGN